MSTKISIEELFNNEGVKYDQDKIRMELLPPMSTIEVGKVLTFGAVKYDDDNWKKVPDLQKRYTGAAMRHMLAFMSGETPDPETGYHHLAHAICCLMFIMEKEFETSKEERSRESDTSKHKEGDRIATAYERRYDDYQKRSM